MASSLIYRQLVLFDCDDGRLSLFKNHDQYLSKIPGNCECFIFWNDLKFPVYKKLERILRKYSHIHLCPTYREQTDDSCTSDLLFYLDKLITKFSSVLLVHGDGHAYRKVFKHLTEQYGTAQMGTKTINKPFSQHLPDILKQLRAKNRESRHQEYFKSLFSKDQLKHGRRSFFPTSMWNYENNRLPYDFEEITNFKRIVKRKQKNLGIYFYNARLYRTTQFTAEFDVDDQYEQNDGYLSEMGEQEESSEFEINLQDIFSLLVKRRQGRLKYTFAVIRKFGGKPVEFISRNIILSSNSFVYQKPIMQGKV